MNFAHTGTESVSSSLLKQLRAHFALGAHFVSQSRVHMTQGQLHKDLMNGKPANPTSVSPHSQPYITPSIPHSRQTSSFILPLAPFSHSFGCIAVESQACTHTRMCKCLCHRHTRPKNYDCHRHTRTKNYEIGSDRMKSRDRRFLPRSVTSRTLVS